MKRQKSNNFIAAVLGNKKISRVVLTAYVLLPILIFAVGFASWTIVTPEFGFSLGGSFVGNELLDSTKYIGLADPSDAFTVSTTVGGFVTDDGEIVNKTEFDIKFNVKLGECQNLFQTESGGQLYFTFALCFADRTESTLFDKGNFDFAVTIGEQKIDNTTSVVEIGETGVQTNICQIKPEWEDAYTTETITSSSYLFVLALEFPANNTALSSDTVIELNIRYTLTPQSAEHYRELMNIVFGESENTKSLMSDVRITDYKPY